MWSPLKHRRFYWPTATKMWGIIGHMLCKIHLTRVFYQ